MSGPPPPPRRRNLNYQVADTGAGSAMNAVKLKQRTMKVSPSKHKPNAKAVPRVQQIVTSDSGQINYSKKSNAKYYTGAAPNSWGTALDTARTDNSEVDDLVLKSQSRYLYDNDNRSQEYEYLLDETPETSVGKGVDIRGELAFERLLRIDGKFEGSLTSAGSVVVGREGCLIGDVIGMECLIIDGGRVVGDVNVDRVVLRGTGTLLGSLVAKSMKVGPHCTVISTSNVHALAPEIIDIHGDIVVDEPQIDMKPLGIEDYIDPDELQMLEIEEEEEEQAHKHHKHHKHHKKKEGESEEGEGEGEGGNGEDVEPDAEAQPEASNSAEAEVAAEEGAGDAPE